MGIQEMMSMRSLAMAVTIAMVAVSVESLPTVSDDASELAPGVFADVGVAVANTDEVVKAKKKVKKVKKKIAKATSPKKVVKLQKKLAKAKAVKKTMKKMKKKVIKKMKKTTGKTAVKK